MPSKAIFNADPAVRDATRDTGLKAAAVRREAMMAVIRNMTKFSLTVDDICQVQPTAQKSRRRDKHFDDEDKKKKEKGNSCLRVNLRPVLYEVTVLTTSINICAPNKALNNNTMLKTYSFEGHHDYCRANSLHRCMHVRHMSTCNH